MKWAAVLALALAGASFRPANAQTVYPPVRYQYGQYGEVFYGGANPAIAGGGYAYLLPRLAAAYATRRMNASVYPFPSPYLLPTVGPDGQPGQTFYSPYAAGTRDRTMYLPYIFSDYLPYEEVGQFGFTVDDARNEAYARVPLYQVGGSAGPGPYRSPKAAPLGPPEKHVQTDPRAKAIPLLDWAKAEYGRNRPLYDALIQQARKFDPAMTARVEHEIQARK